MVRNITNAYIKIDNRTKTIINFMRDWFKMFNSFLTFGTIFTFICTC